MSKANGRIVAVVITCLAAGLLLAGRGRAGDRDPLKDAEARQKVAAEQAERDARDTIDEAYKLARSQPAAAIKRIQDRLQLVDLDPNLSDDQKAALTALLKRGLANIQKSADAASNPDLPGFHSAAPDPRSEEQKKIINDALARITSSKEALADSADVRAKKSEAIARVFHDIDVASIPPSGEPITFPKNWKELSLLRSKNNTLTETEKAILKALNATVTVEFKDQRFGGVIDWFQKQMGQTIVLDKGALDDINVNTESTVSLQLNKVSTRTALKKVLADLGLTYIIKDETIYVTTPAKAKDEMTVRTYYIGDLVGAYDMRFGPSLSQYQALASIGQLVQMIQSNIDPDSWQVNGKDNGGSIVFDQTHMTLIVKQSAEIHYKMIQGFNP